ncbi:MAG: hypothetical protein KDA84_09800, partial [Planctomycetaceae bacterium]|nr:hypothetical protein [Planctomycetaceae bacterium]
IQDGTTLQNLGVLDTAPREIMLRFSEGQVLNPDSLRGIEFVRSGFDGTFFVDGAGNPVSDPAAALGPVFDDSVPVSLGTIQIGERPNEVIVRFADTLVDDNYQIRIRGTGNTPLRNEQGLAFNGGEDRLLNFEVDRGAQIEAAVHQPIVRNQILRVGDPSQLVDEASFTIQVGGAPKTFEFEDTDIGDGVSDPSHIAITFSASSPPTATALRDQIQASLDSESGTGFDITTSTDSTDGILISGAAFSPIITPDSDAQSVLSISDGNLEQRKNLITVYFNANDELEQSSAESPAFYRLISTNGDVMLPVSVTYNADSATAVLDFGPDFETGTYNLRIGESFEGNNRITPDPLNPNVGPVNLGAREVNTSVIRDAFIGGNPNSTSLDPNDVDLYRFELNNPAT